MVTLLIAEDDYYTRKGLIRHIDPASVGIDQILEAENGEEGLILAKENRISLLLTDIKMPHVNGIELAQAVRDLYPDCILLFLSGYSDKEYLKSALSLRTFRYIDKPVSLPALTETLRDAVTLFNRLSFSDAFSLSELEKETARLLTASPANQAKIRQNMARMNLIPGAIRSCRTCILQLLNHTAFDSSASDFTCSLSECLQLCTQYLRENHIASLCSELHECYILIHLYSFDDASVRLSDASLVHLFGGLSAKLHDYPCFIALGSRVSSVWDLASSYQNAAVNLQHNFYFGAYSVSGVSPIPEESYDISDLKFHSFQQAVISRDHLQCISLLKEIKQGFLSHPNTLISNTRASYYRLVCWLFRYAAGRTNDIAFQNETYLFERANRLNTLESLHDFLTGYLQTVLEVTGQTRDDTVSGKVHDIINAEYANPDLSIQFLCSRLHLSASHLSYLFKQAENKTILQYIQEVRIGKAAELLTTTELKISEIGKRCGYPDPNYFTKIFHKATALLPSDFREMNKI